MDVRPSEKGAWDATYRTVLQSPGRQRFQRQETCFEAVNFQLVVDVFCYLATEDTRLHTFLVTVGRYKLYAQVPRYVLCSMYITRSRLYRLSINILAG